MALDGLVISNIAYELSEALVGGHISRVHQPESDALLIAIKNNRNNYKLLISANASLPLIYLTEISPDNPAKAPNFCMLLRKHIGGGKILYVTQPGLERIIHIGIQHLNEMGDICEKVLIVELMGKHSNIILCQPDMTIVDSIKHISSSVSSLREVLPGREYFIAQTQKKLDPLGASAEEFAELISAKASPLSKAIYSSLTGISPLVAEEICFRAGVDSSLSSSTLSEDEKKALGSVFSEIMADIGQSRYTPSIIYDPEDRPLEFSSIRLSCYSDMKSEHMDSVSDMLRTYYASRNAVTRMRQKSSDLRKIVSTALERSHKKYSIQLKQMKDTEKKDKYRIYGEMINTYGYGLEPGTNVLHCLNYYDNTEIDVPLDPMLSAQENSVKYFDRYAKLKRTAQALEKQLEETRLEIEHLSSIQNALEQAGDEEVLSQVKEELVSFGYIKRHPLRDKAAKKEGSAKKKSRPYHYISSDGFHIYVGKNNFQNDEITFSMADGNDWWFHAKKMPGSHVLVKSGGAKLPDMTFEEAGRLAAYYSQGRESEKVEIDYIQKKHVKKTPGGPPGFVIYHTNFSMVSRPDISGIEEISG